MFSIKTALEYLNLAPTGKNYKKFHSACATNNLSAKRFDFNTQGRTYQYPLDDYLKLNGRKISSDLLKRRLWYEDILEETCSTEDCNVESIWNNQTLVLQLDHINGDNGDNRLENLRILCPNCHS